ncbi:MAG TPA: hypothetical protein VJ760_00825 [Nitrospiraceae bacterium]|nr:hypothetical protein [Nitrospiraceae bacterium]
MMQDCVQNREGIYSSRQRRENRMPNVSPDIILASVPRPVSTSVKLSKKLDVRFTRWFKEKSRPVPIGIRKEAGNVCGELSRRTVVKNTD